jgi:hypothetical protein
VLGRAGKRATQLSSGVRCTERKKKMTRQKDTSYGVGWYSREEWEILKEVSVDTDALDNSYEEWLLNAENNLKQLKSKNIQITKVHIRTNDLIEWCKDSNMPIDGKARSQYTALKLQKDHEKGT